MCFPNPFFYPCPRQAASLRSCHRKVISLSLVPTGKSKIIGCFWKIFCFTKDPFTHLDKGGRNAHPFLRFSKKNFLSTENIPSLIWNYKAKWHPISQKKMRKYFSVVGALFCLLRKPPSLIPTGRSQMHTLNLKKFFIPSLIWNWEAETHPVFTKILKNIFWLRALILLAQKVPSLIPTENSQMHPLNLKKILSLHLFGIGMPKRNLFFRKNRKNFLKRLPISKTSPHLFPSGEGIWG